MEEIKEKMIYRLVTRAGLHEYDITVTLIDEGKQFDMSRSNNPGCWVIPGEPLLTIIENDGAVRLPKIRRTLSIVKSLELGILLRFISIHGQKHYIDELIFDVYQSSGIII